MWEPAKFADLKRQGLGSVVRDFHGRTLHRSKNLRGLIEYARSGQGIAELKMVTVLKTEHLEEHGDTKYGVCFYWNMHSQTGTHALCVFADWRVLMTFLNNAPNSRVPEILKVSEELYPELKEYVRYNHLLRGTVLSIHYDK